MSRTVVTTIEVRCSLAHAFKTFTRHVNAWWPPGHRRFDESEFRFEGELGGALVERSPSGEEIEHGMIIGWEPPHRLVYTWHPGSIDEPTEVEVRFAAQGSLTVVTVTHSEANANLGSHWPQKAALFTRAWANLLPAFAKVAAADED